MSALDRQLTSRGWHQALAFAICGETVRGLDCPQIPQLPLLMKQLDDLVGIDVLRAHRDEMAAVRRPWPHPVPDALRAGLGAAQFAAALAQLQAGLGLASYHVSAPSTARALTPEERRLLLEVPPHHVGTVRE